MIFGGTAVSYFLDSILFDKFQNSSIFNIISFLLGLILMWAIIKVSKNTGRTLAKYGRKGNIKRMETNVLATEGIYKYMRHPMHLGLLFVPLAIALLLGSLSFILIIAPVEILIMLIMIKFVEEPEAKNKFGKQYSNYMKQVPWFCFSIECLKFLFRDVPKNQNNNIEN